MCNPKRDLHGLKYCIFCPRKPSRDQASEIYTPKPDDEHPRLFHMGVLPPPDRNSVSVKCRVQTGVKMQTNLNLKLYRLLSWTLCSTPRHNFTWPIITKYQLGQTIHRMQIWRITRSAPGTSHMKSRLVRPQCFVLTINASPEKPCFRVDLAC